MKNVTLHSWKYGEWDSYSEYYFRDDVCKCGCIRRITLNEFGKEWGDGYTMPNGNTTLKAPNCERNSIFAVAGTRIGAVGVGLLRYTEV